MNVKKRIIIFNRITTIPSGSALVVAWETKTGYDRSSTMETVSSKEKLEAVKALLEEDAETVTSFRVSWL